MKSIKSIKVIAAAVAFFIALSGCSLNGSDYRNLKVTNNTDEDIELGFWPHALSIQLDSQESVEFKVIAEDDFNFYTPWGIAYGTIYEDNTLEINVDGFYVGEEKFPYWNGEL